MAKAKEQGGVGRATYAEKRKIEAAIFDASEEVKNDPSVNRRWINGATFETVAKSVHPRFNKSVAVYVAQQLGMKFAARTVVAPAQTSEILTRLDTLERRLAALEQWVNDLEGK